MNFTFLTSEDDYISYNYTVVFQPGDTSAELRIPILDDSLGVEGTEDFFAALIIPASSVYLGVSAGSVDSATVSILDDDNVTVQFSMSEYEVSEGAGEVVTSPAPAEQTSAEVSIAIFDDSIVGVNEMFTAVLSVPAAESALGVSVSAPNGTAYVEIQDNGKAEPSTQACRCLLPLHLPLSSSR